MSNEKTVIKPESSNRQMLEQINQQLGQTTGLTNQHQLAIDTLMLRTMQQQQILDQYRVAIYNLELRSALMVKMMEEKGFMAKEEFDKRWPVYLKNEVGIIGPEGKMEGSLKVSFYGN
jgi:hypothetical protein